jgi:hypothetical protein
VHQWLLGKGPMATGWLMKTAGCSYPTVAGALGRLDHVLRRASNRKVELRDFPKEEWARLITVSDRVRSTVRFVDASGKPRPPEAHLRRLEKLKVPNLGVGGVLGARIAIRTWTWWERRTLPFPCTPRAGTRIWLSWRSSIRP